MSAREIVHAWFQERLASGRIARDTDSYNQVFGALPDLIARLDPSEAPAAPAPEAGPEKVAEKPAVEIPVPDAPEHDESHDA